MKTTFSLLFYLKRPKNYENGPMPIYLRITVNGKRAETTSGRESLPANWNSKLGRFRDSTLSNLSIPGNFGIYNIKKRQVWQFLVFLSRTWCL
ncbi:Arm DNA-binding domain-containing protein [Mucilaginibacter sp.]|uniref:Arm DNA-binding domain-containing protein n=1 Tax=Mucilaginibacter sp. TaxID=1882438 RepID=UPI00283AFB37|nr:Arm DNA-binding domain-containing protein [Mucilaginibacter sp.]MDR3696098.1 Arm DNA-binding domain-containing protein [Mucilaginibacter sp.]